jgi:hypothetical protein
MRALTIALVACLLAPLCANAQDRCAVQGMIDPTAIGSPVIVDAAADGAAHLGHMPMVEDADRGRVGPSFVVTDVQNGFAYVTAVQAFDGATTAPDGWIATTDIRFVGQTHKGFAAPDAAAAVVWQSQDWLYPDAIAELTACQGDWAEVRLLDAPGTAVWLRGTCANQQTTCDGTKGD